MVSLNTCWQAVCCLGQSLPTSPEVTGDPPSPPPPRPAQETFAKVPLLEILMTDSHFPLQDLSLPSVSAVMANGLQQPA